MNTQPELSELTKTQQRAVTMSKLVNSIEDHEMRSAAQLTNKRYQSVLWSLGQALTQIKMIYVDIATDALDDSEIIAHLYDTVRMVQCEQETMLELMHNMSMPASEQAAQ